MAFALGTLKQATASSNIIDQRSIRLLTPSVAYVASSGRKVHKVSMNEKTKTLMEGNRNMKK